MAEASASPAEDANIRFKLNGFDGSNEAAVDEISMMIDLPGKRGN